MDSSMRILSELVSQPVDSLLVLANTCGEMPIEYTAFRKTPTGMWAMLSAPWGVYESETLYMRMKKMDERWTYL